MKHLPPLKSFKIKSKRPTTRQYLWVAIGFNVFFVCCVLIWPEYWFAMFIFLKGVIKNILLSVWHKMLQFFLGLTSTQVMSIGVKRYFMDNIVSKNMRVFIAHLIDPLKQIWQNIENKILLVLPAPLVGAATAFWFGIDKVIALFLQKGMIAAFFKWLWTLPFMLWKLLNGRFIRPIMELLAINWLWSRLEQRFPILKRLYAPIYRFLSGTLFVVDSKIQKPVKKTLDSSGRKVGGQLNKIAQKMEQRKTPKDAVVPPDNDESTVDQTQV